MQNPKINFDDLATAFAAKSNKELRKMHLVFSAMKNPWIVKIGVAFTQFALYWGLPIKGLIRKTVYAQFCGGESIRGSLQTMRKLGEYKVKTILDYSVEGETIELGFDRTMKEIVRICEAASKEPDIPFSVVKPTGIGSTEVMTRLQADETLSEEEKVKLAMLRDRARDIAQAAKDNALMFMIDAEETWIQDVIDDISYDLMKEFNMEYAHVFNTFQMYRKDSLLNLKEAILLARQEGFHLGVKLVRGAYMEKERERAEEMGYESPIQPDKEATDRDFDAALELCLENIDVVSLLAGTHNEQSCQYLVDLMAESGLTPDDPRVWFAQLYGMSDNISFNLAKNGYNVAKYLPYGPIEKVMPYLSRRAKENTAIAGQSGRELTMIEKEIIRRKSA